MPFTTQDLKLQGAGKTGAQQETSGSHRNQQKGSKGVTGDQESGKIPAGSNAQGDEDEDEYEDDDEEERDVNNDDDNDNRADKEPSADDAAARSRAMSSQTQ